MTLADKAMLFEVLLKVAGFILFLLLINGKIKARNQRYSDFFAKHRTALTILALVGMIAIVGQYIIYVTEVSKP